MKIRTIVSVLASGLLVSALAGPVAGAKNTCQVDVLSEDEFGQPSSASFDGETDEVTGRFFLAQPNCPNARYVFTVLDDEGDATPIGTVTAKPKAGTEVLFLTVENVVPLDTDVCVYIEAFIGRALVERGPAEGGCVLLFDDGTSPGGGKAF